MADKPTTWVLTGSPENYAATRDLGFTVIGMKERRRIQAMQMETGDRIVLYLTRIMSFAASVRITGELYEDREKIWPGKPGAADAYPWRFGTEPEIVLEEASFVKAETLKDSLAHIQKWPSDHWKLAFQGQLRTFSEADSALLMKALRKSAKTAASGGLQHA